MMSGGDNSKWEFSWAMLRSGRANVLGRQLEWKFTQRRLGFAPISMVQCEMRFDDIIVYGGAEAFFAKTALTKAFAEAWERLWCKIVSKSEPIFYSSNGFAAGPTDAVAMQRSKEELIERQLLITAWEEMFGWNKYLLRSSVAKLLRVFLESRGWSTDLFILQAEGYAALAAVARHENYGAVFDTCFRRNDSELKLMTSLIRSVMSLDMVIEDTFILPEDGHPKDHAKFYLNKKNLEAFNFFDEDNKSFQMIELSKPQFIKTRLLYSANEFPAVAVSYHEDWKQLNWGKNSVRGKNPWPHPLA